MFNKFFSKVSFKKTKKETEKAAKPPETVRPKPVANPKPAAKPNGDASMVPLFSWRTLTVVVIGLILGLLLGLVFWIISPSLGLSSETTTETDEDGSGFLGFLGMEPEGPFESKVRIQVVSPGSEYIPLRNLQQMGEYYGAKAGSLPFLEFLNKELPHQMPGYTYDVDTLGQMITSMYDYNSELPLIKITVVADKEAEAGSLAELIPQNFRDYLTTEEQEMRQKEYDTTLIEIDNVKAALYDAQKEVNALQADGTLMTNPSYISVKAKVDALQQLLDAQVIALANPVIEDRDISTEYDDTLEQISMVSSELEKANRELEALLPPESETDTSDATVIKLTAEINGLQGELNKVMTGYIQIIGTTQTRIVGLAEMIAEGDTTGPAYTANMEKVETISQAMADAQKQLDEIQVESTQPTMSLTYQLAKIKTDTLNTQLSLLLEKAGQLYQEIIAEKSNGQTDYQAAFEKTSVALAEAKRELEDLEKELGYDRLAADLEYKIAEDKVLNLNVRLEGLTEQLGMLVGQNTESSVTDYLVAGNPTIASPVLPERGKARNTLLVGAIAGIVIAWGILNYRWIAKGMPSSHSTTSEGDGEK
jgi:hypothetical protein